MQQCTCLGSYKQHSTASTFEVSGVVVACQRPAKRRASERRGCDWFDVDFETLMFGSPGPVAGSPPSTPHPISLPSSILYLVFSSTMSERNPKCCIKTSMPSIRSAGAAGAVMSRMDRHTQTYLSTIHT